MRIDHDAIEELLQEAAVSTVLPYWQALEPGHVEEKGPDELVTLADRRCEAFLAERLVKVMPRSLVVGEELASDDPDSLLALRTDRPVWVIDPLDGTANFANHSGPFAIMLCLVKNDETLAAWVFDPLEKRLVTAENGGGAWTDGRRVCVTPGSTALSDMRGALMTRFLPPGLKEQVESRRQAFAETSGSGCAGHDYFRLVSGDLDFLFYYRTLVWDHAPGTLIAEEAGCRARRYDGSRFRPASDATGLLCTTSEEQFDKLRALLVPDHTTHADPGEHS